MSNPDNVRRIVPVRATDPGKAKKPLDPGELEAELERLRHREALLDATEQVASIGHCEWDFENNRIKSCSDGYARIFGQSVEEVLETHSSWDRVLEALHPEDRDGYIESYKSQQDSGSHEVEYRILRQSGEIRHIYETGTVEFDADGKAIAAFGLLQDITERKLYQRELENRDAMAQQVENITDIGHFIFDLVDEKYTYLSRGFARIHGVSIEEYQSMVDSRLDDVEDLHPEDYDRVLEAYARHKEEGDDLNIEYRIYRSDGAIRWIREQGTAVRGPGGEPRQSIGVIQDITEQKSIERSLREARDSLELMVKNRTRKLAATVKQLEAEVEQRKKIAAELDFLANHDALTGLPSLRLCKDRLDHSLAEARRNRQMSAVMFLDLDGFKEINDAHGHEFGDQVLKTIADRIKTEIRETDTVARIGGDEFVIISSSLPESAIAERIASSLIRQISRPIHIEDVEVAVSASIGIAFYPDDGATAEQLIRSADKAMYEVKRKGRNAYGFA
ncbi:MAG: diguanylate cyclase [Gammaproteobacteria bacterium]|jgi:diguanylate cyclase (GGDEF)-like protein/PAS domain S-box-containing protein